MTRRDVISPRQFLAAAFVSALSLLIRRFPRVLAAAAGRSAILAVPLSALPMLALLAGVWLLFRRRAPIGLAPLSAVLLGNRLGRLLTGLYGLWAAAYAGCLLRFGAERFLTTVYPGARPWIFVGIMALICAVAAAGRLAPLTRAAMLFRPLLLGLILAVALLTAKDVDPALLLPLHTAQPLSVARAALEIANLLSVLFLFGFFGGQLERPLRPRDALPWLAALLGVLALMTGGCLGMFGPAFTAKLRYPYFMLVRDLTVLGALERIEPAVVALWVFSDFILLSLLLRIASGNLRFCLGLRPDAGRVLAPVCAAAAAAAALALPGSMEAQQLLSERLVPLLSALLGLGPLPLLLLAELRQRRKAYKA